MPKIVDAAEIENRFHIGATAAVDEVKALRADDANATGEAGSKELVGLRAAMSVAPVATRDLCDSLALKQKRHAEEPDHASEPPTAALARVLITGRSLDRRSVRASTRPASCRLAAA